MEKQINPKLEIKLSEAVRVKLLRDKCFEGSNNYGPFYLYSISQDGIEKSFFAPADIHSQIVAHGLKTGSEFIIRKVAAQNGKKITGELVFEVVPNQPIELAAQPTNGKENGHVDNFKELMRQSISDALEIAGTIPGIDAQRIGMTMFIARTKSNGYS
jgi:hypothetical protein